MKKKPIITHLDYESKTCYVQVDNLSKYHDPVEFAKLIEYLERERKALTKDT